MITKNPAFTIIPATVADSILGVCTVHVVAVALFKGIRDTGALP